MGIAQEFREFAMKGNVVDLAVGVIVGAAFGRIVDSLVGDIIMPLIGRIVGKLDFSNFFWVLSDIPAGVPRTLDTLKKAGVPVLAYGNFLTISVNFLLLAFVIFVMVKQFNRLKNLQAKQDQLTAPPPTTPEDILLLREIRDSLNRPGAHE